MKGEPIKYVYNTSLKWVGEKKGLLSAEGKPDILTACPPEFQGHPNIWSPEDLYIDDPTLPEGEIKQIDWKAWGAKVYFDYMVKREGETIYEKTFYSNYKPWQSVNLRGTAKI